MSTLQQLGIEIGRRVLEACQRQAQAGKPLENLALESLVDQALHGVQHELPNQGLITACRAALQLVMDRWEVDHGDNQVGAVSDQLVRELECATGKPHGLRPASFTAHRMRWGSHIYIGPASDAEEYRALLDRLEDERKPSSAAADYVANVVSKLEASIAASPFHLDAQGVIRRSPAGGSAGGQQGA